MTKEEALKLWLPVIKMGVESMPECSEALDMSIKALEQDQKIGHWISHIEHCEMNNLRPSGLGSYFWCSECDCGIENSSFGRVNYNYCPECGAKMS